MEEKKRYKEFSIKHFTFHHITTILFGIMFGTFIYQSVGISNAVVLSFLYIMTVCQNAYIGFNKDNIEALNEEIENLKKKLNKNK